MIINKRMYMFVLFTIIIQGIFINLFNLIHTNFPFLDGVPVTSSFALEYRYLLNWYIPIIGMSFYFSGYISDMTNIHGIPFFVRNYSKSKWMIKQYFHLLIILITFILFQLLISTFYKVEYSSMYSIIDFFKSFVMYVGTLFTLFSIQLLLELYVNEKISHLMINLYIVFSVLITNQLQHSLPNGFHYFFLPTYGMGFRNGLSKVPEFELLSIDFFACLIILFSIQFVVVIASIVKIKKMDLL